MHWIRLSWFEITGALFVRKEKEGGGGWVELRKPLNQYDNMKSVGGHEGNGNRLHQNVTSGKVIKPTLFLWEVSSLNKAPPLLNWLLCFEGKLPRSNRPYGYQMFDILKPFLPRRRSLGSTAAAANHGTCCIVWIAIKCYDRDNSVSHSVEIATILWY